MSAVGFPRALLTAEQEERYAYFERYLAAHRLQQETDAALVQALAHARMVRQARPDEPAGAIILVFGPTGVGKTRVRLTVGRRLTAAALLEMQRDPGYIPTCAVDIKGPDGDRFSWPDFYERALMALHEPLIAYKCDPQDWAPQRSPRPACHGRALRLALEQCVRHRRVDAFFLDEAHHLGKVASGSSFKNQLESIKSLADMTSTTYVLMGTYDLLQFRLLNGQLGRRCLQVHFPRYRADQPEDVREFRKVVRTFQKHLPLEQEPELERAWQYYYDRSVGCVGVLKEWLSRALLHALAEGAPTLLQGHIERAQLPADELLLMARDLATGEQALAEGASAESYSELGRVLRRPARSRSGMGPSGSSQPATTHRRAGERRPTRDPGGVVQHAG